MCSGSTSTHLTLHEPMNRWTRAWKSPPNPNGFWQSFCARATSRTPDKPGSPPALRTLPLSLLYKNELGSTIGGWLNLTLFTLFVGGSTMVFIEGVRQCCVQRVGTWGPLVWPVSQATWSGGQVFFLHRLGHWIP
jgi:hypothetical protein